MNVFSVYVVQNKKQKMYFETNKYFYLSENVEIINVYFIKF